MAKRKKPEQPTNARIWQAAVSQDLHDHCLREAKRRKVGRSELVRIALAALIGDKALAASRPPGRPRKPQG